MAENVGAYADKYLGKPEAPAGELREKPDGALIRALRESCEQMDYQQAEALLRQLGENRYPEAFSRKLEELSACCDAFDYDRLDTLVQELGEYEA